jgi:glutathione S-transferase
MADRPQPYKKEKEFLAVNPLGLVPALEHKGKGSLYESDVLVEYLEDLYPDSPEHPSVAISSFGSAS